MISYKEAGVDKSEGYKAVDLIKGAVAKTHNANVLNGLGSFASLYALEGYKEPVLVSGTDGVGTKLEVAFSTKQYDTVGQDCFAMCANDILCHGAKPLFFLDYLACGKLDSEVSSRLVKGIASACEATGCALVGGETAEMPGFYKEGDYDLAGFCVGVAERSKIVNGSTIEGGESIISLASDGLHSNGFSLVRKLISDYNEDFNGEPVYKELLKPTALYTIPVLKLIEEVSVRGMAHITGGGLIENVPRTIPEGFTAKIQKASIERLPIFDLLEKKGVAEEEMWNTFNMGVGYVVIVAKADEEQTLSILSQTGVKASVIGSIEKDLDGNGGICLE